MRTSVTCWGLTPNRSWRWVQTWCRQVALAMANQHQEVLPYPEGMGVGSDQSGDF